jgi:hypothetical protein
MRFLAVNAPLAIVLVASVLVLIVSHEVLAAVAGPTDRFPVARRRLVWAFTVLGIMLTIVIAARFYYLRSL